MKIGRTIICGLVILLMVCVLPVAALDWTWSTDGWTGWSHTATWTGTVVGPNSEYGPVIVNGLGEHGSSINLLAGTTSATVGYTFIDQSGVGWNSITFKGRMTGSDVPSGRWMTINVNGQQVFSGNALSFPPGNSQQDFEIQRSFPHSNIVTVDISNGQNPAWGPYFGMQYDSLELSNSIPKVSFNKPDTALCEYGCYNPPISAVISGLGVDQKVDLQLTYEILHPSTLQTEKKYIMLDNVGNGEYPITPQMFGVTCLWPGIPPESAWPPTEQKVMEIHFGANLLDPVTENCITQPCTTGSQDYYWYPWVCGFPPISTPEFPSIFLPATMIIGMLGAVLLIQRTREH